MIVGKMNPRLLLVGDAYMAEFIIKLPDGSEVKRRVSVKILDIRGDAVLVQGAAESEPYPPVPNWSEGKA